MERERSEERRVVERERSEERAQLSIEEAARNKIGDTASADGSDHTVQALDRFRNAAQAPTDTNAASKKQRLMFASYSTPDNAHESSVSAATRTVEQELECYLTSPRLPPTTKVLDFWKANMSKYPQLSQLVRATYGIPSGSASAERCFSAAGLITRLHRLSMKPKTLEKLPSSHGAIEVTWGQCISDRWHIGEVPRWPDSSLSWGPTFYQQ